jgi:hypothetical protein
LNDLRRRIELGLEIVARLALDQRRERLQTSLDGPCAQDPDLGSEARPGGLA